jgi:O-methyltransferase domain
MALLAEERGRAVASSHDFSTTRLLVDVGGGQGAFVESILRVHNGVKAVVYDAPVAVRDAERRLAEAGLLERVRFEAGDFFTSVPDDGDTYTLNNVLHDWEDEQAISILHSCREAMGYRSRLLVVQDLAPTGPERSPVNVLDISLLVLTGGRERTLDEYRELLAAAGLTLERVIETSARASILEAAR